MSSLKEIKNRINSVNGTLKITSAMRMISSAKMHKSQMKYELLKPYKDAVNDIVGEIFRNDPDLAQHPFPLAVQRPVHRRAVVVISSDGSLCGAFNANVIKRFNAYYAQHKSEVVKVYCIGKKIAAALNKQQIRYSVPSEITPDKPEYQACEAFCRELEGLFLSAQIDRIDCIYNRNRSMAVQETMVEQFLPFRIENYLNEEVRPPVDASHKEYFLYEPDTFSIAETLLERKGILKLYATVLNSYVAEQSARTVAMQIASDNATKLLRMLGIQYNKLRQSAITNELLDMAGGSL